MNERIKIFIVEYDCVSLITLMLWLDQFPDFEVLGATIDTGNLRERISELQPDVVLLDITMPGPQDVIQLREIKAMIPTPAVLLLYHGVREGLLRALFAESDCQLGPDRTLGDLHDAIVKTFNKRQVVRPLALAAKAG